MPSRRAHSLLFALLFAGACGVLPGYSEIDEPFSTGNNDDFSSDALFVAPGWKGEANQYQEGQWNNNGKPTADDAAMSYGGQLGIGWDHSRESLQPAPLSELLVITFLRHIS